VPNFIECLLHVQEYSCRVSVVVGIDYQIIDEFSKLSCRRVSVLMCRYFEEVLEHFLEHFAVTGKYQMILLVCSRLANSDLCRIWESLLYKTYCDIL